MTELSHDTNTDSFEYFTINANKLTSPIHAVISLYKHLSKSDRNINEQNACEKVESLLENLESPVVLLIDELDLLLASASGRRSNSPAAQKVIYNFFEWPCKPDSRLIVIAIANTMDLPERVMLNKISSRVGLTRSNFKPYTFDQLEEIVKCRLLSAGVFHPDGITFCARKVASVSGDARKALEICRRAVEILQAETKVYKKTTCVTVEIVTRAVAEIFATSMLKSLRSASLHQKIFLAALVKRCRITGLLQDEFYMIAAEHITMCETNKLNTFLPTINDLYHICSQMHTYRWVLIEGFGTLTRRDARQLVKLNVGVEDVVATLLNCEDEFQPKMAKLLK